MAGYFGYSKSNNAVDAEEEGRMPLSRAVPVVAKATGLTRAASRSLLEATWSGEWHHTSKRYNRTRFFDVAAAIERHRVMQIAAMLPEGWEAPMTAIRQSNLGSFAERAAAIEAHDAAYADQIGVSVEDLTDAYYL